MSTAEEMQYITTACVRLGGEKSFLMIHKTAKNNRRIKPWGRQESEKRVFYYSADVLQAICVCNKIKGSFISAISQVLLKKGF